MHYKRLFRFMIALLTVLSLCVGLLPGQTLASAPGGRTLCAPMADDVAALPAPGDQVTMNGDGSADNLYQITTYAQLKEFRDLVNGGQTGIHAILMNDITADDNTWTPIGQDNQHQFTGVFDGNGRAIINLSNAGVTDAPEYAGLFGCTKGTVKNLVLKNVSLRASDECGAVAGRNDGTVDSCVCSGVVTGVSTVSKAGGIAGWNRKNITNCLSTCEVTGSVFVGGIAGYFNVGSIQYCRNTGAVNGRNQVGGIAGLIHKDAFIQSCINTGTVTASGVDAGGVVGASYGTIENCCSTGAVSGDSRAGGILGSNGKDAYGSHPCLVKNCFNTGAVSGSSKVGGVVGENGEEHYSSSAGEMVWYSGTVVGCYWLEGTVSAGVGYDQNSDWQATSLNTAQFQQQSSFAGWDFKDTWYMGPDTPLLYFYEQIGSVSDWNWLAAYLNEGFETSGWRVSQTADLSVSAMAGSEANPFRGVYNGGGHTLDVQLSGTEVAVAPFRYIGGATIRDLKITGAVQGNMHCSGLVGAVVGSENLIQNCLVSAQIRTGGTHCGGIVGHGGKYKTSLVGCVFNGSFQGGTKIGTIWGWSDGGAAPSLTDCLDLSESSQPMGRGYNDPGAAGVTNCYYLAEKAAGEENNAQTRLWTNEGSRAWAVKAGEKTSIDFGQPEGDLYTVSGITPYPLGLEYNGVFYAGQDEQIILDLTWNGEGEMPAETGFYADAGILEEQNGGYMLVMPGRDVTIYAHTHTWKNPTYEWIEDDSKVVATAVCSGDATHIVTETVKTNFVLTKPSTYVNEGAGYYEAVFDNPRFKKQIKMVVIPPVECAGGDDCPSKDFTDMPPLNSTMHIPIDWAVVNKITTGTSPTTFGTKNPCTRAQFVTFLWRTRGQPEPTSTENPFTDVKESGFYYKAMLWAVEEGITAGTSPTTFGPNKPCTRAQVVTFLWRMEGSQEPASTENPFTDVKESGFYYQAMLWAVGKGITTGTSPTTFGPGSDCTRAQCVTFLYREFAT